MAPEDLQLRAVELATELTEARGATQMLEFVAKRLIWGEGQSSGRKMVMLGTPLYVAAGD
jgi:hypothetical protein